MPAHETLISSGFNKNELTTAKWIAGMTARSLRMDAHGQRAWQNPEAGDISLPVKDVAGCGSSQNTSPARELQRQLHERVERGAALPAGAMLEPGQKLAIVACAATASWLLVAALFSAAAALAAHVS